MKLFSLICDNGLGHYKRTIAVLDAIIKKYPGASITVACAAWQIERTRDWEVSERFWRNNVIHLPNIVSSVVGWKRDPKDYYDESLLTWHKKLKDNTALMNADIVLSDNLPQILHYRSDAILLGSFLWSDVLVSAFPEIDSIQKFAKEEQRLLSAYTPYMICLKDMAMEGILNQCKPVLMPWFCKKVGYEKSAHSAPYTIAILGGATKSFNERLSKLAVEMAAKDYRIYIPKEFDCYADSENLRIFDYQHKRFLELDAIICRPGIGTLTDAVKYSIPVLAAYENANIEMSHNAARIQNMKIGIDLGADTSIDTMIEKILDFLKTENLKKAKAYFVHLQDDGINESADWIIKHYRDLKEKQQKVYA